LARGASIGGSDRQRTEQTRHDEFYHDNGDHDVRDLDPRHRPGKFRSVACRYDADTNTHAFETIATTPAAVHNLLLCRRWLIRTSVGGQILQLLGVDTHLDVTAIKARNCFDANPVCPREQLPVLLGRKCEPLLRAQSARHEAR
jgi:hypothetical protein